MKPKYEIGQRVAVFSVGKVEGSGFSDTKTVIPATTVTAIIGEIDHPLAEKRCFYEVEAMDAPVSESCLRPIGDDEYHQTTTDTLTTPQPEKTV